MHDLQKILLKRLFTQNDQRYGSLTSGYDFEDNVVFHLNQLITSGLVSKNDGVYALTLEGVKAVAKLEPTELVDKGVKTFFIGFLCSDQEGNYLIKSHPQAKTNFYNLPSGKPFFGEDPDKMLARTFKKITGIEFSRTHFDFKTLHLKTIKRAGGEVIFDDAFAIYEVKVDGISKRQMQLGENIQWMSIEEIEGLKYKWPEIDMCILNQDKEVHRVYTCTSDYIL